MNGQTEEKLINEHPAMFKNRPILFIFCIVLIVFFGIGLVLLGIWYVRAISTTLTITNKRTILRYGILSKHTSEVRHQDVRNIIVNQSLGQRLFNVGTIAISSSGQSDVELQLAGIRRPQKVADLIRQHQT